MKGNNVGSESGASLGGNSLSVRVLGVMSGTSCDGLDLAWIDANPSHWGLGFRTSKSIDYTPELRRELQALGGLSPDDPADLQAALDLERRWTVWVAAEIQRVGLNGASLVGFSGQTWYHAPDSRGTRAIGDCLALSKALALPVVGDYRSADVAAGGRGAPLVPLFDEFAFPERSACLNLGGIANLSAKQSSSSTSRPTIGYTESGSSLVGWDICGCNLLLNRQAARLGLAFDRGGAISSSRSPDLEVLQSLNAWSYLQHDPPKALAAEDLAGLHQLLDDLEPEVALSTATAHIGATIARDLVSACTNPGRVLTTGGGAWNEALLEAIECQLKAANPHWEIERPQAMWVNGKEAAAFAWLALRTAFGEVTSLASATGARRDVHGGKLYGNFAAQRM